MRSPGQVTGELDTQVRNRFDWEGEGGQRCLEMSIEQVFEDNCLMTFETELMSCWM